MFAAVGPIGAGKSTLLNFVVAQLEQQQQRRGPFPTGKTANGLSHTIHVINFPCAGGAFIARDVPGLPQHHPTLWKPMLELSLSGAVPSVVPLLAALGLPPDATLPNALPNNVDPHAQVGVRIRRMNDSWEARPQPIRATLAVVTARELISAKWNGSALLNHGMRTAVHPRVQDPQQINSLLIVTKIDELPKFSKCDQSVLLSAELAADVAVWAREQLDAQDSAVVPIGWLTDHFDVTDAQDPRVRALERIAVWLRGL